MYFFTKQDHLSILSLGLDGAAAESRQSLFQRMIDLHHDLLPRLHQQQMALSPNPEAPQIVVLNTTAAAFNEVALTLLYTRDPMTASSVEQLMGRDGVTTSTGVRARHHPVIEIRLTGDYLAVELVVSPFAWYDQQNFAGKLTIEQHRQQFYHLLHEMGNEYLLGFWSGVHRSDMHLSSRQLPPRTVMFDYLDTFAPGRDWLRLGHWFKPESDPLHVDHIVETLNTCIMDIYRVYEFIAWTSNNNYQSFYHKAKSHI